MRRPYETEAPPLTTDEILSSHDSGLPRWMEWREDDVQLLRDENQAYRDFIKVQDRAMSHWKMGTFASVLLLIMLTIVTAMGPHHG